MTVLYTRRYAIAAAAAALTVSASYSAIAADKVVKVGLMLGMSGPAAALGESIQRGVNLYTKLHDKDLPQGVKVDVILRDDAGSPDNIRRIAQELIVRDRVNVLAGVALSPQAFTLAPLATEAKMPLVIMNASTSSVTQKSPYVVRVSNTLWQESYTLGKWAAAQGHKKAYTLVADYAAGHDAEAAFQQGFKESGGEIVGSVRPPMATTDYLPFMQPIKGSGADSLFLFVNAGRLSAAMKAVSGAGLREAGIQPVGPGDMAIDDEIAKISDEVLGLITAGHYYVGNKHPQNATFVAEWKKEYGEKSLPNPMAVAGWDGMDAIYALVRQTKGVFSGPEAMEFLAKWQSEVSPRGKIAIDPETRDIVQTVYINKVEKVDGVPTNVNITQFPDVKDPWKQFNPQ